jgi:hypothetical protein
VVLGVLVALVLPLLLIARSVERVTVNVTDAAPFSELPKGSVVSGAWASVAKGTAGLSGTTDFSAITSTGSALIVGGTGLWRSTDGLRWSSVAPRSLSQPVMALGAHGSNLVGVAGRRGTLQLLGSTDEGKSWFVSQASDFGAPARSMGRPFVTSLLWSEAAQEWVAGGGGSDGSGAVWVSRDGRTWRSVLPSNAAGSADVLPDGFGGFIAWWADRVWTSPNGGRTWSAEGRSQLPPRTTLNTVAPGAVLAAGVDTTFSAPTTPLLRSADHGKTWVQDARSTLGLTVVRGFSHDNRVWAAEGHLSSDDSPSAWISTDSVDWTGLPASLKPPGKGSLSLSATIGTTTVFLSGEARLDRFFVVSAASAGLSQTSPCPRSVPRRLVDGIVPDSGDPLPYIDYAVTNRATVEAMLATDESELRRTYPRVSRVEVGPGFGAAWKGANGGPSSIVLVDDYAVVVHLPAASACPGPPELYNELHGAPVFYVVDR